jgi:Kef-type K+ transport system membrane component KefB
MKNMSAIQAIAVAVVLGVVVVAQSPAVVVALRKETSAAGPVTSTVLGVVVIGDLAVILLFALASTLAKSAFGESAGAADTAKALAWELVGSLVVGVAVGFLLAVYLKRVRTGAGLFVLTTCLVVAEVGRRLHLDPLLIALAAGVLIRNATSGGDDLHHEIEASSLPVYVIFFAVAGATIHLDVLARVGVPAVIIVVVRGAGLLAGTRVATLIAGAPKSVQRYAGFGLLPQAGLALALALLFAKTFPEFGSEAAALTLGVVAINEIVAPAIYRVALVRSGEAGKDVTASTDEASGATRSAVPA